MFFFKKSINSKCKNIQWCLMAKIEVIDRV